MKLNENVLYILGYGNITPVTWEGQIVCVCYATIGIPLFLMCIANISGVLGDMFRYMYARVCCRLCMNKKKKGRGNDMKTSAASELDEEGKEKAARYDKSASLASGAGDWDNENRNNVESAENGNKLGESDGAKQGAKVIDDNEGLNDDLNGEDEQDEKVTVPLTITMIIITLYILIGAVLFNQFEGWGLVQSGYFCYITLATIGFGDYVPGQKTGDPYAGAKLILGAIYVLFGMAILAMCFDLMQEEIIAKFTWLGKKLGIIEKDEDDLQEEEEENEAKKAPLNKPTDEKSENFDNVNDYKSKRDFKGKKESSSFSHADDINNYSSPTPSYKTAMANTDENMSRLRSSYLQSIRQNK